MSSIASQSSLLGLILGLALFLPGPARAITSHQIDKFDGETTASWANGHAPGPTWVADGGPNGDSDGYLQISSNGVGGSGGVPSTFNASRWAGNYEAANVTAIELDLKVMELNNGHSSLDIRVVLLSPDNGSRWTSTDAFDLPSDGSWYHARFELSEPAMSRVRGSLSFDETFSDVGRLMIRHDSGTPSAGGSQAAALLGIDNIRAVPEPSTALLLALGLVGLAHRKS